MRCWPESRSETGYYHKVLTVRKNIVKERVKGATTSLSKSTFCFYTPFLLKKCCISIKDTGVRFFRSSFSGLNRKSRTLHDPFNDS